MRRGLMKPRAGCFSSGEGKYLCIRGASGRISEGRRAERRPVAERHRSTSPGRRGPSRGKRAGPENAPPGYSKPKFTYILLILNGRRMLEEAARAYNSAPGRGSCARRAPPVIFLSGESFRFADAGARLRRVSPKNGIGDCAPGDLCKFRGCALAA